MTSALARLYNLGEVIDAERAVPATILEARFKQGLGYALQWAQMPQVRCVVCDAPTEQGAYLVVLLPVDDERGLGCSGVVCTGCAELHDRAWLQGAVEIAAMLIFEPEAGHA